MKNKLNRLVSVFLAIAMVVLSVCTYTDTQSIAYAAENDTVTIHYKSDWDGANIFYWNQGQKYNNPVTWPGKAMSQEDNDWYVYSFENTSRVDFMLNYGGKQTTHYSKTSGEYWLLDGEWYDYEPEEVTPTRGVTPTEGITPTRTAILTKAPTATKAAASEPEPTKGASEVFSPIRQVTPTQAPQVTLPPTEKEITVHFYHDSEEASLYYWNVSKGENTPVAWPGTAMEPEGDGWYRYTIANAKNAMVIFVTATGETEEIRLTSGEHWFAEGSWYDEKPAYGNNDTPATKAPEPTNTKAPEPTATEKPFPTATKVPDTIATPEPTKAEERPGAVATKEPTATPQPTQVPMVTKEAEPTATQGPTNTPRPQVKGKVVLHYACKDTTAPTIYYWERDGVASDKPVTWPGVAMEKDTVDGWYTYTIDECKSVNLIFVPSSGKTADLSRTEGEWWYSGGKWYEYDLSAVTPTPKPTRKPAATKGPTATPVPYDRTDARDDTIYFLMTTRFYDGDPSNNVHCWDDEKAGNPDEDPAWRGDFKGLIEKLDYIKALGFTAIWITPVVENCSGYDYHGYHAINFSKVDPRYESDDCTYQDLINAVHAKGMKIYQDIVLNHSGNFGEANLMPMFEKDETNLGSSDCMQLLPDSGLPDGYEDMQPDAQYQARLALMKEPDQDVDNIYHHQKSLNWDDYTCQTAQIAGDCVDLNTENPTVYNYLVDAYTRYINMGVDGFRIDTVKHISRLTFNEVFNDAFMKAGGENFYMFGEVCTRDRQVWYRNTPQLSAPFYTWDETKDYGWSDTDAATNEALTAQHYEDNTDVNAQPTSQNALLNGNDYHEPDHSQASNLNVIDFPMHWNFQDARSAFGVAYGDIYYNDATYNVTYVDSHDYAPDCAPENQRFAGTQDTWAENLNLMFTWRGIPCIYYGSEIEFQKGKVIDVGPNAKLSETGRAYFGDYLEGDVTVNADGSYTASGKVAETLNYPLSLHIQRLNKIRAAIPALRKGQYSTEGISGDAIAFKRRYTKDGVDSFVCVAISGGATFSGIPNGTYTEAITGQTVTVSGGTLNAEATSKGNMRIYVLNADFSGPLGSNAGPYLK